MGYSASLPWVRAEANIDMVNTWTKIKGNHTIKWGFDVRRMRDDLLQDQTYSPRGIYNFGTQPDVRSSGGQAHQLGSTIWPASCWICPVPPAAT